MANCHVKQGIGDVTPLTDKDDIARQTRLGCVLPFPESSPAILENLGEDQSKLIYLKQLNMISS